MGKRFQQTLLQKVTTDGKYAQDTQLKNEYL